MAYQNPEVETLLAQAKKDRTAAPEKAKTAYNQLQRVILDDAPMAWLGYWGVAWTARSNVQGFIGHPNQSFEYVEQVWLKK